MKRNSILLLVLILVLGGGCAIQEGSRDPLDGTTWSLTEYAGKELIPDSTMTAFFAGGELSGSASCNHYFAAYQARGEELTIEGLGWTEMACLNPEGIMEQEGAIMALLGDAARFQVEEHSLVVRTASGEELVFIPLQAPR